jgi:enamine deaminase RidA (YjgF/YER057c/UK114 family)
MTIEERLGELGLELPEPTRPLASYVPVRVTGSLAHVSGQTPSEAGSPLWTGRLGEDVSIEDGQAAAQRCALQVLSVLKDELGDLSRVRRFVSVTVYVASAPGFPDQPKVANGASDLFVDVLGDDGRHARAAIGVAALPLGVPVEVSAVVEIS